MPTRKWGTEKLVNTTTLRHQVASKVAALTGGRFVVVWEDRSGASIRRSAASFLTPRARRSGARSQSRFRPAAMKPCPTSPAWPMGASSSPGRSFGVGTSILGSVYNADGGLVRSQPVVHSNLVQLANSDAARGKTGAAVVWEQPGPNGIDIGYSWI